MNKRTHRCGVIICKMCDLYDSEQLITMLRQQMTQPGNQFSNQTDEFSAETIVRNSLHVFLPVAPVDYFQTVGQLKRLGYIIVNVANNQPGLHIVLPPHWTMKRDPTREYCSAHYDDKGQFRVYVWMSSDLKNCAIHFPSM